MSDLKGPERRREKVVSPSKRTKDSDLSGKVKLTKDPPPRFKIGPYNVDFEYYRNFETNEGTFVYIAYNSEGKRIDEEFTQYVQLPKKASDIEEEQYRGNVDRYNWGRKINDAQINDFNKPNYIVTVAATSDRATVQAATYNGEVVELMTGHEYSVYGSDCYYVYLINPWKTDISTEVERNKNILVVPREKFVNFFNRIYERDI